MGVPPPALHAGYLRFLDRNSPASRARFAELRGGQRPKVAVVGCIDSRTNPTMVFDAVPGEILIVRNVANLVPAYRAEGGACCTSAALEFAVRELRIEHLVVKGHSGCGGIKACVAAAARARPANEFVGTWTALADEALAAVRREQPTLAGEDLEEAVGQESVRVSLGRLLTYPFVAAAVAEGRLQLHGAWFAIGEADLSWLDRDTGVFVPVRPG